MSTWKPTHSPKTLQATRLVAAMLFAVGVIVAVGVIRTVLRSAPDVSSASNSIVQAVQYEMPSCYNAGTPVYPMRECLVPTATPGAP